MSSASSKIFSVVLLALCAGGLAFGIKKVKESEMLAPYPEPFYLSDEEAAVRPAYNSLRQEEKAVYAALLSGILERKEEIPLPYDVTGEEYAKLYCLIEKQEGDIFYIDSSYYTAEKVRNAHIVYRESGNDYDEKIDALENAKKSAVAGMTSNYGDYEKALYIHDYIIHASEYITGNGEGYSSTAYGCLVEGAANCEGYAKAFDLLASEAGLESILITGITDKGENHAWNQVKVNGSWYNLDSTWDDAGGNDVRRVYFLCDDTNFGKTHYQKNNYLKPYECTEIKDNYYVHEDLYITSLEEGDRIIQREVAAGKTIIPLKFVDSYAYEDFKQKYITNQEIFKLVYDTTVQESSGRISVNLTETRSEHCMIINISWK